MLLSLRIHKHLQTAQGHVKECAGYHIVSGFDKSNDSEKIEFTFMVR